MNKKEVIALVRSDIKRHKRGEIEKMPTDSQYAKKVEMTVEDLLKHLCTGLSAEEQAYYYKPESNEY